MAAPATHLHPHPTHLSSSEDTLRQAGCREHAAENATYLGETGRGEEPLCHVRCTFHRRALLAPSVKMALRPSHTGQTRHRLRAFAGGGKGLGLLSPSCYTERKVLSDTKHLGGKTECWGGDRYVGGLTPGRCVPAHCKPTHLQPSRASLPTSPARLPTCTGSWHQSPVRSASVQRPLLGQAGWNRQCDVRTATLTLRPALDAFPSLQSLPPADPQELSARPAGRRHTLGQAQGLRGGCSPSAERAPLPCPPAAASSPRMLRALQSPPPARRLSQP